MTQQSLSHPLMDTSIAHAQLLDAEFEWLKRVIETRLMLFFESDCPFSSVTEVPLPDVAQGTGPYATLVNEHEWGIGERLTLMLALAPQLKPEVLDLLFTSNSHSNRPYTAFGGVNGSNFSGFLPTLQTALFLLTESGMEERIRFQTLFHADHGFARLSILRRQDPPNGHPPLSAPLQLSREYLEFLTTGESFQPGFTSDFPAKEITSRMEWAEVVLPERTRKELAEIQDWLTFGEALRNDPDLGRKIKPGYKCLFTGPPGTGKTLTACLLGKTTGKAVYRIDLSMIVSKFIGETEKNLGKVFDQAESRDWILFFDEADALFGKRSETQSAHDRYANQEVSYLLQRVEEYNGLVILASNFRDNIDAAFSRRFNATVDFPIPGQGERLQLWQQSFSQGIPLDKKLDLQRIAENYQVSGAQIMNIVQYCTLRAIKRGDRIINDQDLSRGLRKELAKEGITLF